MVKLNKIYTRTGDDGTTGLGTGDRVPKTAPRVVAYGEVDEANAALGLAVSAAQTDPDADPELARLLASIQHDLFDVGADLCIPVAPDEAPDAALRVTPEQVEALERHIDRYNDRLETLTSFVLPGGTPTAAALHLARTVTRRAERAAVALLSEEPETTSPTTVRYLNRLSDLLFVLSRVANGNGRNDVLWKPGANRQGPEDAKSDTSDAE